MVGREPHVCHLLVFPATPQSLYLGQAMTTQTPACSATILSASPHRSPRRPVSIPLEGAGCEVRVLEHRIDQGVDGVWRGGGRGDGFADAIEAVRQRPCVLAVRAVVIGLVLSRDSGRVVVEDGAETVAVAECLVVI